MITNKQVVDVVNKAIEEGEIQTGGLPQIESGDAGKVLKVNEQEDGVEWGEGGADNALVLPEVAPASQQLVGINTSGEQNSLSIGDGLEIAGGALKYKNEKTLVVDFAGNTYLDIADANLQTKLANKYFDKIIVKNYKSASATYIITATLTSNIKMDSSGTPEFNGLEYYIDNHVADGTLPTSFSGSTESDCSVAELGDIKFTGFAAANGTKWRLLYNTSTHKLSVDIGFNYGAG